MKKGILICFMGIDGSGKSTLAKNLVGGLSKKNIKCTYLWWLEAENTIVRKLLRKIGKNYSSRNIYKIENSSSEPYGHLFSIVYPLIVFFDYIRFGILKTGMLKLFGYNLICDRYIYDVIIAISEEFNYSEKTYNRLFNFLTKLLPKPNLVFFIDVPSEVCFERKRGEIPSIEYASNQREKYLELYKTMTKKLGKEKITLLSGTENLEKLKEKVLNKTLNLLGNENE